MSTVTIFAAHDPLTALLADEIAARGARVHAVTIPVGWVSSALRAVVLIDSEAGRSALEELCRLEHAGTQIVVLGRSPLQDDAAEWCDLCEKLRHRLTFVTLDLHDMDQLADVATSVLAA